MARLFLSAVIAIAMTMAAPDAGLAQTPATNSETIPTFRVEIWADTPTDFIVRVHAYSELRQRLERALPEVTITHDVRRLRRDRRWLAEAIRQAAGSAAQITASVRQHAVGMEQIAAAMGDINGATSQSLAAVGDTRQAAENLNDLAGSLTGLVAQYAR